MYKSVLKKNAIFNRKKIINAYRFCTFNVIVRMHLAQTLNDVDCVVGCLLFNNVQFQKRAPTIVHRVQHGPSNARHFGIGWNFKQTTLKKNTFAIVFHIFVITNLPKKSVKRIPTVRTAFRDETDPVTEAATR